MLYPITCYPANLEHDPDRPDTFDAAGETWDMGDFYAYRPGQSPAVSLPADHEPIGWAPRGAGNADTAAYVLARSPHTADGFTLWGCDDETSSAAQYVEAFRMAYADTVISMSTVTDETGEAWSFDDATGLARETVGEVLAHQVAAHPATVRECAEFLGECWADLYTLATDGSMDRPTPAAPWASHGIDFALTRLGVGANFSDREYPADVADRLNTAAECFSDTPVDVWRVEPDEDADALHAVDGFAVEVYDY